MQELQVERSISSLVVQEFESPFEHGIAGSFRRQGHIQTAVPETSLKFQMRKESCFGLALTHGSFHQQDRGLVKIDERVGDRLLHGARNESKNLLEGLRLRGKWSSDFPTYCIKSLVSADPALSEPFMEILAVIGTSEGEPDFVRSDPVGKAREAGQQHEIRAGKGLLRRNLCGLEDIQQCFEQAPARLRPWIATNCTPIAGQIVECIR